MRNPLGVNTNSILLRLDASDESDEDKFETATNSTKPYALIFMHRVLNFWPIARHLELYGFDVVILSPPWELQLYKNGYFCTDDHEFPTNMGNGHKVQPNKLITFYKEMLEEKDLEAKRKHLTGFIDTVYAHKNFVAPTLVFAEANWGGSGSKECAESLLSHVVKNCCPNYFFLSSILPEAVENAVLYCEAEIVKLSHEANIGDPAPLVDTGDSFLSLKSEKEKCMQEAIVETQVISMVQPKLAPVTDRKDELMQIAREATYYAGGRRASVPTYQVQDRDTGKNKGFDTLPAERRRSLVPASRVRDRDTGEDEVLGAFSSPLQRPRTKTKPTQKGEQTTRASMPPISIAPPDGVSYDVDTIEDTAYKADNIGGTPTTDTFSALTRK